MSILAFGLCSTSALHAQEAASPCEVKPETSYEWYDLSHAYISEKLCEPAIAFDRFFGDDRNLENGGPATYARWRNDLVWNESETLAFHTGLNARVKLPAFNNKLKLIVSGEYDDEINNPITLGTKSSANTSGATPQSEQRELKNTSLDLRYDIHSRPRLRTTFDVGVRTNLPLKLHYNLRFRYALPLENNILFRFTETLYWRQWEGYGETSRFDLERLLTPQTLARTSLSATFSEISQGVDFDMNTGLSYKLSPQAGISGDVVASASTLPVTRLTTYGLVTKYRRNYWRKWLFFEIIPQVIWERDENSDFEAITSITLRLDVQFWQN